MISDLLSTAERENERQITAITSLVGMYNLGTSQGKGGKTKISTEVQTEQERDRVEAYLMKRPF